MKEKVNLSDLIIEGEIINQKSYLGDYGRIYTKNTLLPKKLLKGKEFLSNPIEIITWGGEFNGIQEYWNDLLHLTVGEYGVFFLEQKERNAFSVVASDQGFLKFHTDNNIYATDVLNTYSNVHDEIYGKILMYTKTDMKIIEPKEGYRNENCLNITVEPYIPTRNSNINLSILASLTESPLFLGDLEIIVNYTNLDSNIVDQGIIQINYGNELSNLQYSTSISDFSSSSFKISISSIENESNYLLLDRFNKEILKVSISLPAGKGIPELSVSDNQISQSAVFIDPNTGGNRSINCVNSNLEVERECFLGITKILPRRVAAGVEDVSLSGVPGKITISGYGFGFPYTGFVKPRKSDVLFWDVDSKTWFKAAEENYISWSNTKIELLVPTMNKAISNHPAKGLFGAATHTIKVKTIKSCKVCEIESIDTLYVQFGMFNDSWKNDYKHIPIDICTDTIFRDFTAYGGRRRNLVNFNGNGGYNLIIEDMYPNDSAKNVKAREQIIKALDVWRCGYKINVRIVKDTIPYKNDTNTCRIIRSDSLKFKTTVQYMKTPTKSIHCSPDDHIDSAVESFNILVNAKVLDGKKPSKGTKYYRFNLEDEIPEAIVNGNGQVVVMGDTIVYRDLCGVMTHEFGHAFQLRHTANSGDLMAAGHKQTNKLQRDLSGNDILGANHLRLLSEIGACEKAPMIPYDCTTETKNPSEIDDLVTIRPNPNNGNFTITSSHFKRNCLVEIVNINGQTVYLSTLVEEKNIRLDGIMPGLYFVTIKDGNSGAIAHKKMIIN